METFEFKVKIQANTNEEAKKILKGLFNIKRSVEPEDLIALINEDEETKQKIKAMFSLKDVLTLDEMQRFAVAAVEKPYLIKQAKKFI